MAKRNLSALLDTSITAAPPDEDTAAPATPVDHAAAADQAGAVPADALPVKPATPRTKTTRAIQSRSRASAGPRYLELDRKELRIRGVRNSPDLNRRRATRPDRMRWWRRSANGSTGWWA